ncbi:MAG: hypothetical protein L3J93_06000 [Thermoplasmata archaeon]|nr:hypothetical protein [Thermoplasmata archaeon]
MHPLLRPDLYVVLRLLEAVRRAERLLTRTQLQLLSGTNYSQFARYLEVLTARGLLTLEPDPEGTLRVVLTPRGFDALVFLAKGMREVIGGAPPPGY